METDRTRPRVKDLWSVTRTDCHTQETSALILPQRLHGEMYIGEEQYYSIYGT